MMKLVVQKWYGGDYECGSYCDMHCIEYESAEKFYCDLEAKLKEELEKRQEYRKDLLKWQMNPDNQVCSLKTSFFDEFCIGEAMFQPSNLITERKVCREGRREDTIDMPEIYELEEWWNKKRNGDID